ncbi:MAG: 3-phosphoshikimate 1-carboxyvinyltransferase [Oscillospiraceae bacterium]|jgi:3-phosphoshikimate 1-carboxyvinyltransferase|nr:3-phosphoshikimate 1-carboxyvinyltransferase [Oscillospiraceae bacterium]
MIKHLPPVKLHGTIAAPPSKSSLHRLLISAALTEYAEQSSIRILTAPYSAVSDFGEDVSATVDCLTALGFGIAYNNGVFAVRFDNPDLSDTFPILNVRESGSTFRFMLPLAAYFVNRTNRSPKSIAFVGGGKLPDRPIIPLVKTLAVNGAQFVFPAEPPTKVGDTMQYNEYPTFAKNKKALPVTVEGRLAFGQFEIPANVSSQFVSGLLFILPLLDGASIKYTSPPQSLGYIKMTEQAMSQFGVAVTGDTVLTARDSYRKITDTVTAEGDWSNSAFWLAANGGNVTVTGLDNNSEQSDKDILSIINRAATGITHDFTHCPDLFPIVSVLAAATNGTSILRGVSRLKAKESDRISAMRELLAAVSDNRVVFIHDEAADTVTITSSGAPFTGGNVSAYNDHRIAMSAAVAATYSKGEIVLDGAESVNKSYPNFWADYARLTVKTT